MVPEAVFYELLPRGLLRLQRGRDRGLPRAFARSSTTSQWLGVDCLWLLPFYPSPLRDGGYDISRLSTVAPELGDARRPRRARRGGPPRGIRIISDLVMNHTSDQHPWFVESRSSRDNPKADWYMWADDDQRLPRRPGHLLRHRAVELDLRPVAQPVLLAPLLSTISRTSTTRTPRSPTPCSGSSASGSTSASTVSASTPAAYLYKADGTSVREPARDARVPSSGSVREIDRDYPNRVLLAEVNQWPSDVVDYFGDGDECHMCFHFPLMPRMFMAIRREQRFPITEILAQTPPIPDGCQWGIFLRNHDELTFEMVTDEERDYMYAEYARDPRMRRNLGIRRRLAPLVDNDRRVAELLYGLLLSLPGGPVLYYGDEILMGDNIYLGDRDGVRTPMQWTPDRNGGFSTADFAQL